MLTFRRGGKTLPIGGFLLVLVGVIFTARCLHISTFQEIGNIAISAFLLIFGTLMMVLFNTVRIDPDIETVRISSGLRFRPKHAVHKWDEFDGVVAYKPSNFDSDSSYSLYLRDKETQELSILVQQYNDQDEMHGVARKLSKLMRLPAIASHREEESELV